MAHRTVSYGVATILRSGLLSSLLAGPLVAQSTIATIPAPARSTVFGSAVGIAGDVDGDGRVDVVVGDWFFGTAGIPGSAQVLSGANGSVLHTFVGTNFGDTLGRSVGPAGDLDGDGCADVLVGAPMHFCDCPSNGYVRVYSGRTGAVLRQIFGAHHFGWSSAHVGDLDADGSPDYVVGAPASYFFTLSEGNASVYSGASGAFLFAVSGTTNGSFLGVAVSGAGDVNADGIPDVAVGAPQWFEVTGPAGIGPGSMRLLSGLDGSTLWTAAGIALDDGYGAALAAAGDVDGDGLADVLVGVPGNDAAALDAGRAVLLSGAGGAVLRTLEGAAAGDRLGASVAGLGDVDVDGVPDLAAGAPFSDSPAADSGSVRVVSGSTGATLATFVGATAGAKLGTAVGGGGDLDGDGLDDAVLGSPAASGAIGATLVSLVPAGLSFFGLGLPGCTKRHHLSAGSAPAVGNGAFELRCDHAPASSLGLGIVANAADPGGADPFGLGVPLYVDFAASTEILALDFMSDAAGFGAAAAPIPPNPLLHGTTWHAQALWAWGAACSLPPYGLSSSHGLTIAIP